MNMASPKEDKHVIGFSRDEDFFYFYTESESQTQTRIRIL